MKNLRKYTALLLCVLMVLPVLSLNPVLAEEENAYPESEHFYKNNYYNEWSYTYPDEADGLFVTFSDKTRTEETDSFSYITFGNKDEISFEDVMDGWGNNKIGDYISIFDKDNNLVDVYQGKELSGRTIFVPGNTFKISLTTDSSVTAYGFSIDDISTEVPEDSIIVLYDFGNGITKAECFDIDSLSRYYYYDEESGITYDAAPFDYQWYGYIAGDGAVIGWRGEDGRVYDYDINEAMPNLKIGKTLFPLEDGKNFYRFTSVKTPVTLNKDDVYNFINSAEYFGIDDNGGYYMTKKDYLRLVSSACIIHGVGPLALPAAVVSTILVGYPKFKWNGSCIGFTTTVCLQKKGILDLVGTQEGAKCVNDLKPTSDLISLMNYYNAQAALTTVTKNKANYATEKEFSRQLEKMFKSVCDGNLVLMEFMSLSNVYGTYHGFVLTGGYVDQYGNHVLFYYDDNDEEYGSDGKCSVCYIDPEFSTIYTKHYGELETILWTDEFDSYKSIDINGKDNSVIHYWKEWIKHVFEIVREWIEYYILGAFKK